MTCIRPSYRTANQRNMMLMGHNIVYFGDSWDGVLRNRQQLMSIFARHNKVLFVERGASLQTVVTSLRQKQLGLADFRRPLLRQITDNLFVFQEPVWVPASKRFIFRQVTDCSRRLLLKKVMRQLNMSEPIVWFYHPKWLDLVDSIPSARLRLYHVVDEYSSFQDKTAARRRQVSAMERELTKQVDAVIVVSEKLYESKAQLHPNTYLVPNGVNYEAYRCALTKPDLPADLARIKSPRLGYSGLIGDKLELDMLEDLARSHPDWSLVFLGPVNANKKLQTWESLGNLPNVHYLGSVEWNQVPHYVKGFEVGLMPYVQNWNADNISPLKLYDYLAAGLPIASLDIPAARQFSPWIHLAAEPKDFEQAVYKALADQTPERSHERRSVAAQHTWEVRVEQLSELILTHLTANGRGNGLQKTV